MNKKFKIILYILGGLVIFYHALKFTGILVAYSIPSTSSEPTIKLDSYIIASNLITPKRGDFITYNFNDSLLGESTWMHRLCGMENDTIQITNGISFVNGENFDEQYNLRHSYLLNEEQYKSLGDSTIEHFIIKEDTYLIFLDDTAAQTYKFTANRYRDSETDPDPRIKNAYQQDWNKDHFGPLIIPKGKIFLLGDNRDNSMDSRFTGLIDASDMTGVYWITLF